MAAWQHRFELELVAKYIQVARSTILKCWCGTLTVGCAWNVATEIALASVLDHCGSGVLHEACKFIALIQAGESQWLSCTAGATDDFLKTNKINDPVCKYDSPTVQGAFKKSQPLLVLVLAKFHLVQGMLLQSGKEGFWEHLWKVEALVGTVAQEQLTAVRMCFDWTLRRGDVTDLCKSSVLAVRGTKGDARPFSVMSLRV